MTSPTLILGGGFTGLFTALDLSRGNYASPIVLVDRQERFLFKPLLYEFLSGEMDDSQVCPRYDELLPNTVAFVQDSVESIDLHQQQVKLASGLNYHYENLVLALGSVPSYFGIPGAAENTIPFQTIEHAVALRRHLRDCLQKASQTADPDLRRTLLTVNIIGAGPSGIELAVTLADLLPDWYAPLGGNPDELRIVVIEREPHILGRDLKPKFRELVHRALEQRSMIQLQLNSIVTEIQSDRLLCTAEEPQTLEAATLVWTAGTAINPLIKSLPIAAEHRDPRARPMVSPTLQLPEFPNVFAGGDCVVMTPDPYLATAQVAYQQGRAIARNLKALDKAEALHPAEIHLRGWLIKLGLGKGAASLYNRLEISGKPGHLIRQATYLELLPTPIHNIKATLEWLTDEVIDQVEAFLPKSPTKKEEPYVVNR